MIEKYFQNCIDRLNKEDLPVEGMAVMDKAGFVLMQHHWTQDIPHNIYSNTKSFTGTAVGMAIAEGKLSLDDKVADFFPESVPIQAPPLLYQMTLRDLLTMSSGFGKELLMGPDRRKGVGAPDYVKYMLEQPIMYTPGTKYCYSSGDTILAGRMCEKAVGMGLPYYLYTKFFSNAEMPFPLWEHCPTGHAVGAAGLYLKLIDMMKLGVLYLNGGYWKDKKLLEESWIQQATQKQIEVPETQLWDRGYGYQFKILPYQNAFRADGMFGQETIILPMAEIVFGIQCPEHGNFKAVMTALHEELLGKLSK